MEGALNVGAKSGRLFIGKNGKEAIFIGLSGAPLPLRPAGAVLLRNPSNPG
jgi:hypothetical protein